MTKNDSASGPHGGNGPRSTKQRVLDAAERLFSLHGFRGTSLRAVTGKARANLAAVNYHFGSKEALLKAVFERRLLPLNRLRKERLEGVRREAKKKGRKPAVREVLKAFIEPALRFKATGSHAEDFIALIGQAFAAPDDTMRKIFMRFMRPMFRLLFETLSEAMPELPRDVLFWRIYFTMGAMAHAMHTKGTIKPPSPGFKTDCDVDSLTEMLISFVTAGMENQSGKPA